jgi:hypothetical protein
VFYIDISQQILVCKRRKACDEYSYSHSTQNNSEFVAFPLMKVTTLTAYESTRTSQSFGDIFLDSETATKTGRDVLVIRAATGE